MEKSSYRAYILVCYKLGKSVKEIHDELTSILMYGHVMFKSTVPILIHCLDKGKTINAQTYIVIITYTVSSLFLVQLRSKDQRQAPKTWKYCMTKVVREYLNNEGIAINDHPPYLPGLAPCDFGFLAKLSNIWLTLKMSKA